MCGRFNGLRMTKIVRFSDDAAAGDDTKNLTHLSVWTWSPNTLRVPRSGKVAVRHCR